MMMGARIKEARTWMGLSLREAGSRMGVSYEWLRQLESYDCLSRDQVKRICSAFPVNEAWLETGEGQMFTSDVPKAAEKGREELKKTRTARDRAKRARERAEQAALKPVRAAYVRDLQHGRVPRPSS